MPKIKYTISYDTSHTYRNGRSQLRRDSKEVTVPTEAFDVRWDTQLKTRTNKQGNKVHGMLLSYRKEVGTKGGGSTVKEFERVVEFPEDARNISVRKEMNTVLEW